MDRSARMQLAEMLVKQTYIYKAGHLNYIIVEDRMTVEYKQFTKSFFHVGEFNKLFSLFFCYFETDDKGNIKLVVT